MSKTLVAPVAFLLAGISLAAPARALAQVEAPANPSAPVSELIEYEATGLSLLSHYEKGKVPVLFIHGLWLNPASWHRMIETLEDDPTIKGRYQFWTFGYSTGDPIPYSAYLLRRSLTAVRHQLDPDSSDPALDRMVLVGHSMGGLLSKMMVSDAGDLLWRVISDRPEMELRGEPKDVELFRSGLFFAARPEVRRVVYIATPHRGSHFDRGAIRKVGTRLVRIPDPLRSAHLHLVAQNGPDFFRDHFRKALPTSIEELEWGSPLITGISKLSPGASVKVHSIIAVRPESPPSQPSDGLVSYASAHIEGAASEKVVATSHLCQDHPGVIAEVRRILLDHLAP